MASTRPGEKRLASRFGRFGIVLVLIAFAASAIYPIFFVVATALRSSADYDRSPLALPSPVTFSSISSAWQTLAHYLVNSAVIVCLSVAALTVISLLAGYALTHMRVPFARALLGLIVGTLIVPASVLLIPTFQVVLTLGLLNNRLGLGLVYATLNLPFSIYLMATFVGKIPRALLEAARVDGAGPLRALGSIVLPLVGPAVATLVTLNFLVLWNELLFSLIILQQDNVRTLMPGIVSQQGQYMTNVPTVAAGLLFSITPTLLIFLLFQRDLARGLTTGAVK